MQVYAVIYDKNGKFIVAKKNTEAWFWADDNKPSKLKPNVDKQTGKVASQSLTDRGGGKYCFPGGEKLNSESFIEGALREFEEETGYNAINQVDINTATKNSFYESKYQCVFFKIKDNFSIDVIVNQINNNLAKAKILATEIENRIANGTIDENTDINDKSFVKDTSFVNNKSNLPLSNELESCTIIDVNDIEAEEKKIIWLRTGTNPSTKDTKGIVYPKTAKTTTLFEIGKETGWFYDSLEWFKAKFEKIKENTTKSTATPINNSDSTVSTSSSNGSSDADSINTNTSVDNVDPTASTSGADGSSDADSINTNTSVDNVDPTASTSGADGSSDADSSNDNSDSDDNTNSDSEANATSGTNNNAE